MFNAQIQSEKNINKITQLLITVLVTVILFCSFANSKRFLNSVIIPQTLYFTFFSSILLSAITFHTLLKNKSQITLNKLDIIISFIFLYDFIILCFTKNQSLLYSQFVTTFCLLIFYFSVKQILSDKRNLILNLLVFCIIFVSLIHTTFGLVKIISVFNLPGRLSTLSTFDNVGVYGAFLSGAGAFSFSLFLFIRNNKLLKYISLLNTILILIIIPFINSRTAVVSFFAVIFISVIYKYRLIQTFRRLSKAWRVILIGIAIIAITFISMKMYYYKETSAFGRLHIWDISLRMIQDKPLFGFGYDSFNTNYNNYQAQYFKVNKNSLRENVADSGLYAFNEYLQILVEKGIFGFILFFGIIAYIFILFYKINPKSHPFTISSIFGIFSILISSMFSYSLHRIPIMLLLFFFLGIISSSGNNDFLIKVNRKVRITFFIGILIFSLIFIVNRYNAIIINELWKKAHIHCVNKAFAKGFNLYFSIYPKLKSDKYFLYNYGTQLSVGHHYEKSIEVLQDAEIRINDAELYIYLGDNYENVGNIDRAEYCFEKASLIVPSLFYPKYRLALIYNSTGRKSKALRLSEELIHKKIKVNNSIVDEIKKEMLALKNSIKTQE